MIKGKRCAICGEVITGRTSNNIKYCGEKCARVAEKRKRMEYLTTRAKNHNAVAHQVYAVYNCKCAICGWQATENLISCGGKIQYAHGNEIHHICPVKEGGGDNWENVILLCPNHHKMADIGILSRDDLKKVVKPYRKANPTLNTCVGAITQAIFSDSKEADR